MLSWVKPNQEIDKNGHCNNLALKKTSVIPQKEFIPSLEPISVDPLGKSWSWNHLSEMSNTYSDLTPELILAPSTLTALDIKKQKVTLLALKRSIPGLFLNKL